MNKTNIVPGGIQKNVIHTQHVYSQSERVFQKSPENKEIDLHEWSPINFQWQAVVELNTNLNHPSNHIIK